MRKREETIAEYDKRIWGNVQYIAGFLAFIIFQFVIVNLFGIGV